MLAAARNGQIAPRGIYICSQADIFFLKKEPGFFGFRKIMRASEIENGPSVPAIVNSAHKVREAIFLNVFRAV